MNIYIYVFIYIYKTEERNLSAKLCGFGSFSFPLFFSSFFLFFFFFFRAVFKKRNFIKRLDHSEHHKSPSYILGTPILQLAVIV